MRRIPAALAALLVADLTLAGAASAQGPERFDAVMSGLSTWCFGVPIATPVLQWLDPDRYYYETDVIVVDSPDGRTVLAAVGGTIVYLTPSNRRTTFFEHPDYRVSFFAVAPNGRVFAWLSSSPTDTVLGVISPTGALEATHALPSIQTSFFGAFLWDAGDDCTLFFAKKFGRVGRMNACTGAALSDFETGSYPYDIEPAGNGQFLVASRRDVLLYDGSGALIRRVATVPAWSEGEVGQVALSADAQAVWYTISGCTLGGSLGAVTFADGADLLPADDWLPAPNFPNALVLGASAADVQAASPATLLLLALTLALAGLSVLRR